MVDGEIAIAVTFVAGRYHGREWPPSAARLYQAMLAGVMTGGYRDLFPDVEAALRWLEQRGAPSIFAAEAKRSKPYRIAVPNNDLDSAGLEWAAGREANVAQFRTMKTVAARQATGDEPHVIYVWKANAAEIAQWAGPLRRAAQCLYALGWGMDMAFADVVHDDVQRPSKLYLPSAKGRLALNVPVAGTLDDLQATYRRFVARTSGKGVDTYTRPSMVDTQRYRASGELHIPVVRFRLLDEQCENNLSVPWSHCMKVAGWLRHGAGVALRNAGWPEEQVRSYVEGHTNDNEKGNRISYVPLPSIAGGYADGRIRRVMLLEPATSNGQAVEALNRLLPGRILTDDQGRLRSCLLPVDGAGDYSFSRYVRDDEGYRTWRSVTPIVLHGFNVQRRGVIDLNKTEKLLLKAFEMAGFNVEQIEGFSFQAGPMWPGTSHAAAMLVPQHLGKYPRLHVEVSFRQRIAGPVLAGIGRHYGIGVFAGV